MKVLTELPRRQLKIVDIMTGNNTCPMLRFHVDVYHNRSGYITGWVFDWLKVIDIKTSLYADSFDDKQSEKYLNKVLDQIFEYH